jgi:outer membrane beta-barrel protein
METRFQRIFLKAKIATIALISSSLLFTSVVLASENDNTSVQVKADVERRNVLIDKLDSENIEIGVQAGLISIEDFESSAWLSAHMAYHINEYFYLKARYGQATAGQTSFERLVNSAPLLTDKQRELSYYGLNIGYNLMPGEIFLGRNFAFNSVFSVELGGGTTKFTGDNNFTVNLTANYRVFLNDWIAWDIGMSDYIFDTQITGESKTTHNLNFTSGFSVYF